VVALAIGAADNAGHSAGDILTLVSLGLLGWAIAGSIPRRVKVTWPTRAAVHSAPPASMPSPSALLPTAAVTPPTVPALHPSELPPSEDERRLQDEKKRHNETVTKGLIAGVVALLLVVVVVAVSSSRGSARCGDAHSELHTAYAAIVANGGRATPQESSFLMAVIENDPSCFDAATRAFAKVGGNDCHLRGNSISCASG
jgi:hypothetical protein